MIPNDRLLELLRTRCYKQGEFTLSSGRETNHYVNCKPVTLSGEGLYNVASSMLDFIDKDVKAVAGLTLGADPLVSGVAMHSYQAWKPLDALIVRKEPKGHGTGAWIEGPEYPKGTEVTVLEDVTTTGGSAIKAVDKLRDAGYVVKRVVTIVDRQEGAIELMATKDLELRRLFTVDELV